MKIQLRKATSSDLGFLLNLRIATMQEHLAANHSPCTEADHFFRIRYQFDAAKIIESNGQAAGLMKAKLQPENRLWYLYQLQVAPEFQGQGIGSQAIKMLIELANKENCRVGLSVFKSNPAKSMYEHLGFKVSSESKYEYEMLLG